MSAARRHARDAGGIPECIALVTEFTRCKADGLSPTANLPSSSEEEKRKLVTEAKQKEEDDADDDEPPARRRQSTLRSVRPRVRFGPQTCAGKVLIAAQPTMGFEISHSQNSNKCICYKKQIFLGLSTLTAYNFAAF